MTTTYGIIAFDVRSKRKDGTQPSDSIVSDASTSSVHKNICRRFWVELHQGALPHKMFLQQSNDEAAAAKNTVADMFV